MTTRNHLLVSDASLGWRNVGWRFEQLLTNISPTPSQYADAEVALRGVSEWLDASYWSDQSPSAHTFLSGSWAKGTQVRPLRDVDILFELPAEVYHRFDRRLGNKQSQLLQEVRTVLGKRYSRTEVRGDGQAVIIPFARVCVEVVPAFRDSSGWLWICDASQGGQYQRTALFHEVAEIDAADRQHNGCVRPLIRMLKALQRFRNIEIRSFVLERLALEFVSGWPSAAMAYKWYDWLLRDSLFYLLEREHPQLILPGSGQVVDIGRNWKRDLEAAHKVAVTACAHEAVNADDLAGATWQTLFGSAIPRTVRNPLLS